MRYGFAIAYNRMPGSKGLSPHELAHKRVKDLGAKSADTEKQGIGTFWAFFGFTLPDSLDMIKIETVFTGYKGRVYVQKKTSQ